MSDSNVSKSVKRYSDQDLAEFLEVISQKLEVAKEQAAQSHSRAMELNESLKDNGYDLDENHAFSEVEFLNSMVVRLNKHIRDLENALLRIKNKNYGICTLSGTLIDKRRLLAVPTTTKSLQSKKNQADEDKKKGQPKAEKKTSKTNATAGKQFTKVIKKDSPKSNKAVSPIFEEEELLDIELEKLDIEEIDTTMELEE